MEEYRRNEQEGKTVFVGVDLHRFKWHVTVMVEGQEFFSGTVPGTGGFATAFGSVSSLLDSGSVRGGQFWLLAS